MRALVVYESMYGNTHTVALQVAEGLRAHFDVSVVPVGEASAAMVAEADLLVVGGPTHAHGMTRGVTRRAARDAAASDGQLVLDRDANGPGLREWFAELGDGRGRIAAAVDTRVAGPALFTGRASKGIAHHLERHGYGVVIEPESFLVDKNNHLLPGEADRAVAWGDALSAVRVALAKT